MVIWSLEVLESVPEIAEIIPVLKVEDMEQGQRIFEEYNLSKIKRIAAGGKERQDSVYNGLKLIEDDNCIVLIHDGVRPLIEERIDRQDAIGELISPLHPAGKRRTKGDSGGIDGVILGCPLKDTIKEAGME